MTWKVDVELDGGKTLEEVVGGLDDGLFGREKGGRGGGPLVNPNAERRGARGGRGGPA